MLYSFSQVNFSNFVINRLGGDGSKNPANYNKTLEKNESLKIC